MKSQKFPRQFWPYGAHFVDGRSVVLFDRKYRPVVRIPDGGSTISIPAHDGNEKKVIADIPIADADRCGQDEKIEGITNTVWFYSENDRGMGLPEKDGGARNALAALVVEIPELAAEIAERSARHRR